jgi:DNA polymerase I-like protein with 3'-5' exonuclease and polymerase domains
MRYVTIDLETNTKNTDVGNDKPSPHCPANGIVAFGVRSNGGNEMMYDRGGRASFPEAVSSHPAGTPILLVGQNISFDLKYLMRMHPDWWESVASDVYIWDTQQVAYLLSGHAHTYPSLDQLCEQAGLPLKDDKIKQYWADGLDTSDIPYTELKEYLFHDLEVTETIFKLQYEKVKDNDKLFNLIRVKMDDLLCTTVMEHNGMHFDLVQAHRESSLLDAELTFEEKQAIIMVEEMWLGSPVPFNPHSPQHVSLSMFGGDIKGLVSTMVLDEDGSPVKYKSGKKKDCIKYRKEEVVFHVEGMGLSTSGVPETKVRGIYSTGDEVLKNFTAFPFVQSILNIRAIQKEISTYYEGYSSLVWPHNSCIHPSINHCSTTTGRQSCTKPNLQNVTRSEE